MATKPSSAKLDELMGQVEAWAESARTRLRNEKKFLEVVQDKQGLTAATKKDSDNSKVTVFNSVKDYLSI